MADFAKLDPDENPNDEPPDIDPVEEEEIPGEGNAYTPAMRSSQFYPSFAMETLYYTDTGRGMMGVAGDGVSGVHSRPVRQQSPQSMKAVFWQAARIGLRPVLPDPDTSETNPNEVLLKILISVHTPQLMAGGNVYFFAVEGIYIYGLMAALKSGPDGDSYWAGCSPCAMDGAEALKVEGYQFSKDLLACQPPLDYDEDQAKAVP